MTCHLPHEAAVAGIKLPWLELGGGRSLVGSEFFSLHFLEKHINDNRRKWVWEEIGCPLVALLLFPVNLTFLNSFDIF